MEFRVNWSFASGEKKKKKKIFNMAGFPTGTILAILIYKSPRYFLSRFESIGISVQEKFKIDFQDGDCGGHLGFPIRTILLFLIYKSP